MVSDPTVRLLLLTCLLPLAAAVPRAAETENLAERNLRRIVERQKDVLAEAAKEIGRAHV